MYLKRKRKIEMGTVTVQKYTTTNPITLIGEEAGICWGADIEDEEKNYRRGVDCITCNHGRALEFPQIYLVLEGWSAKVIREFYTHIAGGPSRLQASTRYIDYSKCFDVVTPPSIEGNPEAKKVWAELLAHVPETIEKLKQLGVPNEDATNVLPLASTTKVVVRTNLRHLIDMCHQRLCKRAYWEYQNLMKEILWQLENYSDEWEDLVHVLKVFKPKCQVLGHCPERYSCKAQKKADKA